MDEISKKYLSSFPKGKLDERIARHTTFKIGGPAKLFYSLEETADLAKLIQFARDNNIRWFILAGGSNILFPDQEFDGLVIKMDNQEMKIEGSNLIASSGVLVSKLVNFSMENDLEGLEKWASLPGTVGGAVRGNAGCHGLESKDILINAEIFDPDTLKTEIWENKDFDYKYRDSKIKKSSKIILSAKFKLKERSISKEEQKAIYNESVNFRLQKQPFGFSAGSFFKNPSQDAPAGLLIEKAGLKGFKIGDACVSEKHANFLINLGNASYLDMCNLVLHIKKIIKDKFDIDLNEEVQIVSF